MGIREHFEDLVMMEKTKTQNEYGDIVNTWTEGVTFRGTWLPASNSELVAAGKIGAQAVVNITTDVQNEIDFGDTIKRAKNGDIVRVTSERHDFEAPQGAEMTEGIAYYLAERTTI